MSVETGAYAGLLPEGDVVSMEFYTDPALRQDFIAAELLPTPVPEPVATLHLRDDCSLATPNHRVQLGLERTQVFVLNQLLLRPDESISFAELTQTVASMRARFYHRPSTVHVPTLWAKIQRLQAKCRDGVTGRDAIEIDEEGLRLAEGTNVIDERSKTIHRQRSREGLARLATRYSTTLEEPETSREGTLYQERYYSPHLPEGYFITRAIPHDVSMLRQFRDDIAKALRFNPKAGDQWEEPHGSEEAWLKSKYEKIIAGECFLVWGNGPIEDRSKDQDPYYPVGAFELNEKGSPLIWNPTELDTTQPGQSFLHLGGLMGAEKGIGTGIIRTVEDVARATGKDGIRIDVWSTNEGLHEHYKKLGFSVVRSHRIRDYPSCMLMELRTGEAMAIPGDTVVAYSYPDRYAWRDPSSITTNRAEWDKAIQRWLSIETGALFRAAGASDWLQDRYGRYESNLRYDSLLSTHQLAEVQENLGLAAAIMLRFWPDRNIRDPEYKKVFNEMESNLVSILNNSGFAIETERIGDVTPQPFDKLLYVVEPSICDLRTFESETERREGKGPLLVEGIMLDSGTLAFRDGSQLDIGQWQIAKAYRLPLANKKERSLQPLLPARPMAGDKVQVRVLDTGAEHPVVELLVKNSGHDRVLQGVDEHARIGSLLATVGHEVRKPPEERDGAMIESNVKQFYASEHDAEEERLLMIMLQAGEIYMAESSLVSLGLVDEQHLGRPVDKVVTELVAELALGTIATLENATTYLRSLEPYHNSGVVLVGAILARAEELGCYEDIVRTLAGSWSRRPKQNLPVVSFSHGYRMSMGYKQTAVDPETPENFAGE